MWTETATFGMDNANKNYKKIFDFGTYKWSGVVMIRVQDELTYF